MKTLWGMIVILYRVARAILVFCVLTALVLYGVESFWPFDDQEPLKQEWAALHRTGLIVRQAPEIKAWEAGVFLSSAALENLAQQYEGFRAIGQRWPLSWMGFAAVLERPKLQVTPGRVLGRARVLVHTDWPKWQIPIDADLSLQFSHIRLHDEKPPGLDTRTPNRDCDLVFIPRIDSIRLGGSLSHAAERAVPKVAASAGRALGSLVTASLSEENPFELGIRMPFRVVLQIGEDDGEEIKFYKIAKKRDSRPKEVGGTVRIEKNFHETEIVRFFDYQRPLIFPGGLWLRAAIQPKEPSIEVRPQPTPAPPDDLQQEIARRGAALAPLFDELSKLIPSDLDYAIWLRADALRGLVKQLAADPKSGTMAVNSTKASGELGSLELDDRSGVGVYRLRAKLDDRGLSGSVRVTDLTAKAVTAGETLQVSGRAHASAEIRIHMFLKAPLFPEVPYEARFTGAAMTELSGHFKVFTAQTETYSAAYWGVDLACSVTQIHLETHGGKLFGGIPVSFSPISANLPVAIFKKKPRAPMLLDGLPQRRPFVKEVSPEKQQRHAERFLSLQGPTASLDTAIIPIEARATSEGYLLGGRIVMSRSHSTRFTDEEMKRRAVSLEKLRNVKFPGEQKCSEEPPLEIVFQEVDFVGTANDLVKYFSNQLKSEEERLNAARALLLEQDFAKANDAVRAAVRAEVKNAQLAVNKAKKDLQRKADDIKEKPPRALDPSGVIIR